MKQLDTLLPKEDMLHSVSLVTCAYFLFSYFIAYVILTFRYCRIKHQVGHQQKQHDWSHINIPRIKFHTFTLNWSMIHTSQSLEKSMIKTHEKSFGMMSSILLLIRGNFFLRCAYFNTWWVESRIITNDTYECFKRMVDTVPK